MAKPYSTKQNLIDRWGEREVKIVADLDMDDVLSGADDTAIAEAIADADAKIDAYVQAKYGPQLDAAVTNPPELRQISSDIAMFNLSTDGGKMNERKRAAHKDAMDFLKDLSKGLAQLTLAAVTSEGGGTYRTGPSRLWTRTTTEGLL